MKCPKKPRRKKRRNYTLQGTTASGYAWAAELGVAYSTFVHNVRSAERAGATREQAMLAVVRHFGGPDPRYGGMWEKLAQIMRQEKEETARQESLELRTIKHKYEI